MNGIRTKMWLKEVKFSCYRTILLDKWIFWDTRGFLASTSFKQFATSAWRNFVSSLSKMHLVKIPIILRQSADWSESSLDAHDRRYVSDVVAQLLSLKLRSNLTLGIWLWTEPKSFEFTWWKVGVIKRMKHYKSTSIQIYWEFYHPKKKWKTFRWKILVIFIFLLKTYIVDIR